MAASGNSKRKQPRKLLQPMAVKYWSRAGIMLTDWCSAACACCYANCSPAGQCDMPADRAVEIWSQLGRLSPHGCRVHLTGGEVFGRLDLLLEVCRRAKDQKIADFGATLESVETNGYWATDREKTADILRELDSLGMGKIALSCDPYHQCFVPLENCRLLADVAKQVLGPDRIKVRWEDWLENGFDTSTLNPSERDEFFRQYSAAGRDRFVGRAADALQAPARRYSVDELANNSCGEILLRGKHVHISPNGDIWPATCIGIVIGNAFSKPVGDLWHNLSDNFSQMPVIKELVAEGPVGLLSVAMENGYEVNSEGYLSKCHLCFDIRRLLHCTNKYRGYLGPPEIYK